MSMTKEEKKELAKMAERMGLGDAVTIDDIPKPASKPAPMPKKAEKKAEEPPLPKDQQDEPKDLMSPLRFTTDDEVKKYHIPVDKLRNSNLARERYNRLIETLHDEIVDSAKETVTYSGRKGAKKSKEQTKMFFESTDSVSAVLEQCGRKGCGKVCLVNFANYTKPGGGYINGVMSAQEESICWESDLCNVLVQSVKFYETNAKDTNDALYRNRALYTPGIHFIRGDRKAVCDVLTIAAPNWSETKAAYGKNVNVLVGRIKFIREIAEAQKVDTLIFGAFGCGVFKQDPTVVATASLSEFMDSDIKAVLFAVYGGEKDENVKVFSRFFKAAHGNGNTPAAKAPSGAVNYGRRVIDANHKIIHVDEDGEYLYDDDQIPGQLSFDDIPGLTDDCAGDCQYCPSRLECGFIDEDIF